MALAARSGCGLPPAAEAVRILGARYAVVAHTEGWAHFTESRATAESAFDAVGLGDRLQRT